MAMHIAKQALLYWKPDGELLETAPLLGREHLQDPVSTRRAHILDLRLQVLVIFRSRPESF